MTHASENTRQNIEARTREYFHRAYTLGDGAVLDEYIDENLALYGLNHEPHGSREEFRAWYRAFSGAFSEARCDVTHLIVDGNWMSCRIVFSGKHTADSLGVPASGKPVTISALVLARFENGKVVEAYNELNERALMMQITG